MGPFARRARIGSRNADSTCLETTGGRSPDAGRVLRPRWPEGAMSASSLASELVFDQITVLGDSRLHELRRGRLPADPPP